jgi:membrane protease subunit (stomatin/prohibitin family)
MMGMYHKIIKFLNEQRMMNQGNKIGQQKQKEEPSNDCDCTLSHSFMSINGLLFGVSLCSARTAAILAVYISWPVGGEKR